MNSPKQALPDSPKFHHWQKEIKAAGLRVHGIKEYYTRHRHNGEVLFGLVELDATTPEGDKIPPVCFIKGGVVSVLVCLIDKVSREKFLLLVRQRRICNGDYIYECVAGMMDSDPDPLAVAQREVEEETGIRVRPDQLQLLNTQPFFCTTGTSDEYLYFYACELEMDRQEIMKLQDQETGADYEHERIYTHVATLSEARQLITNTNGLLNLFLYLEQS